MPAHKFTRANDFSDLSALSRNLATFFDPTFLNRLGSGALGRKDRSGLLARLRIEPRRTPEPPKTKWIFRIAKRGISHPPS